MLTNVQVRNFDRGNNVTFTPTFRRGRMAIPILVHPRGVALRHPIIPLQRGDPLRRANNNRRSNPRRDSFGRKESVYKPTIPTLSPTLNRGKVHARLHPMGPRDRNRGPTSTTHYNPRPSTYSRNLPNIPINGAGDNTKVEYTGLPTRVFLLRRRTSNLGRHLLQARKGRPTKGSKLFRTPPSLFESYYSHASRERGGKTAHADTVCETVGDPALPTVVTGSIALKGWSPVLTTDESTFERFAAVRGHSVRVPTDAPETATTVARQLIHERQGRGG